ncbi:retrovirus-related Pol polyprotein from type-1 retrotransposable element R2 [Elysia marginata]|uniref:Retrovirus-related Pol polyprotein from type-1 retrotransposable element R2 n=1 Tax=Elysia marginata TaxID=1093978 RepID=A0AAV4EPD3_9GAST|nr:retrovirus-related Pol polyprotein from type-1 retrotransposable element R2 [Elysia marginata]
MNIISVPKSGDLSNTYNYRGISLMCDLVKTYNKMILNRIRTIINLRLRMNQNGFHPGHTTVAQIMILRRIIAGVKANNPPTDFKKAFDSIHRAKMIRFLKADGILPPSQPAESHRSNEIIYTKARVETLDGETKLFYISAGVLQGDTSDLFFNFVFSSLFSEWYIHPNVAESPEHPLELCAFWETPIGHTKVA